MSGYEVHLADPIPADLRMAQPLDAHAAKCSCGWIGPLRADRAHAETDARKHEIPALRKAAAAWAAGTSPDPDPAEEWDA